jgi:hypothetical protein
MKCWAISGPSAASLNEMLGHFEAIGSIIQENAGPFRCHRRHPPMKCWAISMPSAASPNTMLGRFEAIDSVSQ